MKYTHIFNFTPKLLRTALSLHRQVHLVAAISQLEDDISTEKPINSLTEEDEYEKQQEQLRLEKEQASHSKCIN